MSWPSAQLNGWSSGPVTLHGSPGLIEQVGGVLGMLWRIRILRDVLFFCKLLRKWCVCMCVCVCCLEVCLLDAMLSSFGGSIVKA